jgi:hypothetical protein
MGGLLFVGDGLPGMLLYGLGCLVSIFAQSPKRKNYLVHH